MIACLSLREVLPQTQSQLLDLCVTWDQSDWLTSRPWDLTKHQCPLLGGRSGPECFGCVLFLWENPCLNCSTGEYDFDLPSSVSPVLASGILSLSLTSKPCHGPEMLATGCHFLPNGLTSWPRGVRGPPRRSKSQPPPDGCWAILLTPWGFDAGPAAPTYLSSFLSSMLLGCA